MIRPLPASPYILTLFALIAAAFLVSPGRAQESAAQEAAEAAAEAVEAALETPPELARDESPITKREKRRQDRVAAFAFAPSPALWKITKAESTVYIFGATNRLPSQLKWESKAFTEALASANKVYFETSHFDRSNRDARRQSERQTFRKIIRHDRDFVEERFAPGLFDQIKDDMKMDFLVIGDFMPTWFLVAFIAETDHMFQPTRGNRYLDYKIRRTITESELIISSLEDPSHLVDLLNMVDEKTQRKWLNDFVRAELAVDKSERYATRKRGNNGATSPLSAREQRAIDWAKGKAPEAVAMMPPGLRDFENHIRNDRMKRWPDKISAMLDDGGTSLVVVNQEYLFGENNLRSALKSKGYELERVQ
ncbi:TraB/GumN family protein [Parasphingorhabdus litoris]|uniref:TraB/GumN family protein n=1 Tax=Parasphingorhabdus litoris TaxID=394733 RepID=A0ABN1AU23_9SPHN|nr:TraB/GumN family protein [Parasphingorhabdus litoris]